MLKLLDEKPLEKITVTDITNRADVNRGTFYLHYNSVNEVISELQDAYIAQNRSVSHMGMMKPETMALLLKEASSNIDPRGSIHFAFQGGEPTIAGLPFFQDFTSQVDMRKSGNVAVS